MGRSPKVLVTGLRHSGTTYVARLLAEAGGYSVGEDLQGVSERQGLEWVPLVSLINVAYRLAGREVKREELFTVPELEAGAAAAIADRVRTLDCPDLVKMPDSGHLVVEALQPEQVVVVTRPMDQWVASMQANGTARRMDRQRLREQGRDLLMRIFDAVGSFPGVLVSYPSMVEDRSYAVEQMALVTGQPTSTCAEVWDRVTRPEWNGENARRFG